MSRSVPEWIGARADTDPPPRVRMRIFRKARRRCQGAKCGRLLAIGDKWQTDHRIALINGGENRESNLQILCDWCHTPKTRADVKTKSRTYRMGAKQFRAGRHSSRPLPGTRESGIRIRLNRAVEPWR